MFEQLFAGTFRQFRQQVSSVIEVKFRDKSKEFFFAEYIEEFRTRRLVNFFEYVSSDFSFEQVKDDGTGNGFCAGP